MSGKKPCLAKDDFLNLFELHMGAFDKTNQNYICGNNDLAIFSLQKYTYWTCE